MDRNFDYKKDKYEQNLRYFRDPDLAARSAGIVVPTRQIRLKRIGRKSVKALKPKMNENKEQLLHKVCMSRKDIMDIKIQYFEMEEQLDRFMTILEK